MHYASIGLYYRWQNEAHTLVYLWSSIYRKYIHLKWAIHVHCSSIIVAVGAALTCLRTVAILLSAYLSNATVKHRITMYNKTNSNTKIY